jgi:hypothetical protein
MPATLSAARQPAGSALYIDGALEISTGFISLPTNGLLRLVEA